MNLKTSSPILSNEPRQNRANGVALVITLLMLAAITFLAIAFLAMTHRDTTAVKASLDIDNARTMSDAALARAQAEVVAQMMSQTDLLSYDYMASHNFITPSALFSADFTGAGVTNSNNVNYDVLIASGGATNSLTWAENIGNLYFDPRPPVFIQVNNSLTQPVNDFRYWIDINRNGRFESNGWINTFDGTGTLTGISNFYHGEPEWIGVLKYPEFVHSPTNPFIGRYAFMVLPIGKTLDLNYIHNYSKVIPAQSYPGSPGNQYDEFTRDEGVGSWELNLGALINDLSPAMYLNSSTNVHGPYTYNAPSSGQANAGSPFWDASQMLGFRYGNNASTPYGSPFPYSLNYILGSPFATELSNIDEYANGASIAAPFDFVGSSNPPVPTTPWPGTYNSNAFYDVQDLFDTNKTGANFVFTMLHAGQYPDTPNRYTFSKLLDSIGMSSAPEYGVYVYSNMATNLPLLPKPNWLRTKVNINYDNTAQIQAGPFQSTSTGPYGPFTPMPTNLQQWTPLGFFTNAADLLLRSQVFFYTNYVTNLTGFPTTNFLGQYVQNAYPSNWIFETFGITNIPVYSITNPSIRYNEQIHRLLQVAANIYAAANPVYEGTGSQQYQVPPVFRPQFEINLTSGGQVSNVYITNFVYVPASGVSNAYNQVALKGFYDLTDPTAKKAVDPNFWGIPWVIGAVKGLPAFDQYTYNNEIFFARQLEFIRQTTAQAGLYPVLHTNQFYMMSISNLSGMDAWNPYNEAVYASSGNFYVMASNLMTISLTNNYNFGTNVYVTNTTYTNTFQTISSPWLPQTFKEFLTNLTVAVPLSYYSESLRQLISMSNGFSTDTNQTTFPTHNWTISVSNRLTYALFDGQPSGSGSAILLDFVNLGPFGSTLPLTQFFITNTISPVAGLTYQLYDQMWETNGTTDAGLGTPPPGILEQIGYGEPIDLKFGPSLAGLGSPTGYPVSSSYFFMPAVLGSSIEQQISPWVPYALISDSNTLMACDPLVHYTIGDLSTSASDPSLTQSRRSLFTPFQASGLAMTNTLGSKNSRYQFGIQNGNIVLGDPGMTNSDAWQFPNSLFPTVGWIGRVHRGTPWQTIYLKSDSLAAGAFWWGNQAAAQITSTYPWVYSPILWNNYPSNFVHPTYPTNDWSFVDLFMTAPNDNAARGLISVNQTNDAAWAAAFAGVIAITNNSSNPTTDIGLTINPTSDIFDLVDSTNGGINIYRAASTNGLFHHIGDILQAPALTVGSPFLASATAGGGPYNDEMVERIPQQTLGLMKLGMPQFVIYAWGQSLKPKNLYSTGSGTLQNLCTNYEITGEYLTRTVCHIVSTDGTTGAPKIVVDNFNIEPGN